MIALIAFTVVSLAYAGAMAVCHLLGIELDPPTVGKR